jgi:hypothetical protein
VVLSPNGRIKPDLVIVNGRPERHSEGAYYLEWREKGRRIRLSVGKDPQDAATRRQRKEAELNAINNGVSVLPENGDGHPSVATAVARFLEETELTKKPKTLAAMHGSTYYGDGAQALRELATVMREVLGPRADEGETTSIGTIKP